MANFVDLKSPYMLGHSSAVSELVAEAGAILGLEGGEVTAFARRPRTRSGTVGRVERDLGQAGPLGRRRMGTRSHAAVSDRTHAAPVRAPSPRSGRSLCSSASASMGRATRVGCPARRSLTGRASSARRCLPVDARTASAPGGAHGRRRCDQVAGRSKGRAPRRRCGRGGLAAAGHRVGRRRERPAGLTTREIEVSAAARPWVVEQGDRGAVW